MKEKPEAIASLEHTYRNTQIGAEPHVEHVPVGETLPDAYTLAPSAPPTPRQLRRFLDEKGLDSTLALLEQFWSEDTTHPIYDKTYGFGWVYELLEKGESRAAQALSTQYHKIHEGGLNGTFLYYGNIGLRLGLKSFARDCFEYLLIIDPDNTEAQEKLKVLGESAKKEGS